ncbi:MAG: nucleotidyltransferase family protein [Candidatus Binatia bacterium]
MIVAVILSAGDSSRMGKPKALLPVGTETFVERIVAAFRKTGVEKILIVLGRHVAEIRPKIAQLSVQTVVNENYNRGQLSSLQTAIRALEGEDVEAILVHLVDHPFVNPGLVDQMIQNFRASNALIVLPRYKDRRGHPVLFSSKLFPELLEASLEVGAKEVVRAHRSQTLEIETTEEGVTIDIDTPDEYRWHVEKG